MVGTAISIARVENDNRLDGPVSTPARLVAGDLRRSQWRAAAYLVPAMRAVSLVVVFGALSACSQPASQSPPAATTPPPGSDYEGAAFEFQAISDDVYLAVETGNLGAWCNAVVIVNDSDVLLVESHVSPAAAWALLRELKEITDKPVRYVVNTHFHFDHLHGNQIYGDDVEIIGHEFTRQKVLSGDSNRGRTLDYFAGFIPGRIEELEAELAAGEEPDRTAELRHELVVLRNMRLAMDDVVPTPPNLTLTDRMTLHRGGREIQLMFLGRGHTGGDVVVYLPGERVLVTGDLLTAGLPWMGDGYPVEWADTLERFKTLDVDVMLPAHGRAIRDFERIDRWQAYLRDFWTITAAMHRQGIPAEEAARRVDLRSHAAAYPRLAEIGAELLEVERVYELLDGEMFDGGE